MGFTNVYNERLKLIEDLNKELEKFRLATNCSNLELYDYNNRIYEIAAFSGRTTHEILSEVNHLLNKNYIKDAESVINYVDRRYRRKMGNLQTKIFGLGTLINKEEDSYMNDRRLDGYDALTLGNFCHGLVEASMGMVKNKFDKDTIKDVIFNDPATIVLWKDGTKTVVKCQKETGDTYNPELGLAMCIIKKCCGNKGNFNDVFNKWLPKESE